MHIQTYRHTCIHTKVRKEVKHACLAGGPQATPKTDRPAGTGLVAARKHCQNLSGPQARLGTRLARKHSPLLHWRLASTAKFSAAPEARVWPPVARKRSHMLLWRPASTAQHTKHYRK